MSLSMADHQWHCRSLSLVLYTRLCPKMVLPWAAWIAAGLMEAGSINNTQEGLLDRLKHLQRIPLSMKQKLVICWARLASPGLSGSFPGIRKSFRAQQVVSWHLATLCRQSQYRSWVAACWKCERGSWLEGDPDGRTPGPKSFFNIWSCQSMWHSVPHQGVVDASYCSFHQPLAAGRSLRSYSWQQKLDCCSSYALVQWLQSFSIDDSDRYKIATNSR